MKAQYLVTPSVPESKMRESLDKSNPVVFNAIAMQRLGQNGWKCNKKRDPRQSVALQVTSLIVRGNSLSFRGYAKIEGGRTIAVKGSVSKSGNDGTMIVE